MRVTCVLLLLCHLLVTCQGRRDVSAVEHRRFLPVERESESPEGPRPSVHIARAVEQERAVKAPPPDSSIHRLAAVHPEIIAKAPRVPVVSNRDVPETRMTGPATDPRAVEDVPETMMKAAAPRTDPRAAMVGSSPVEDESQTGMKEGTVSRHPHPLPSHGDRRDEREGVPREEPHHYIHRPGSRTGTCSSPSVVTTGSQSNAQIGTNGRHYNNFENCWWRIQSPANQRVRLHFLRFNLEYGNSNCPYDSVNVYDGRDARAPRRGKFCGTHVPRDIISSQNAAFVSFSSDYSIVRSGFRIRYSTVSCNKLTVVTGSNGGFGTVGSPYGNYEYCTWKIQVPAGKRMRLHFTRFNLEYGRSSCPYDRVKIYDGSSVYAPLKGTYCGSTVPSDITSSGNVVFVSFTSDHSITRSGFWIQYSLLSTCSAPSVLTRPLGYFGTVGSSYRNNEQCSWTIQSQGNSKLRLHFTRFDLEYGGRSCPYDKVKVYDGSSASAPLKGTFCGNTLPRDIQSSGGKMFVTFSSDYSVTRPGFRIQYSVVVGSCSRLTVLTGQSGSFGTTGSSYKNYETCSWKIQVPTLKQVLLSFVRFNLEYGSARCPYDKVKIYDGTSASAPLKGTFCGTTVPKFILSRGNTMYITFTSDYSVTASGFWIKYFAL